MISVLYTRPNSIYKKLVDDCYDINRDARSFKGGNAIIAHPPCRGWGNYSHLAKTRPDEHALAIHSVIMIRLYGGVLEHPVRSKLWKIMQLPKPGQTDQYGGWSLNIDQYWFGHRAQKNSMLYIVGCEPKEIPPLPLRLNQNNKISIENMCKAERERTPIQLALWLIKLANICNNNKSNGHQKRITWT